MPLLWLGVFLILGTWCLVPGAFLFTKRAQAGTIADHDYVASRDLLLNDDEATRHKQAEARNAVLPVYDLDPGAAPSTRGGWPSSSTAGARVLGRQGAAGRPARRARRWSAR